MPGNRERARFHGLEVVRQPAPQRVRAQVLLHHEVCRAVDLQPRQPGQELIVETAAGVFCPDRVDMGTAVLLAAAPAPPPVGNLLDLGSGWGPIALSLGLRSPGATIWAVDVNQRALALARDNAKTVGINDFHAMTPDEVPADIRFDAIWSNPPIRVGKSALHKMLLTWLPRLEVGGTAYLVVQKNLGADTLQRWLADHLEAMEPGAFTVARHTTAKGFRVLAVHRNGH